MKKLTLEHVAAVQERYNPAIDDGAYGRRFEVWARWYLSGRVDRCHPASIADVTVRTTQTARDSGVIDYKTFSLECKSGAGWLLNPVYETPEQAEQAFTTYTQGAVTIQAMRRSRYVAYIPRYDGLNGLQARVYSQEEFLAILHSQKLIRVKKSTAGEWGIAIQEFRQKNSPKREIRFREALAACGQTIEAFYMAMRE